MKLRATLATRAWLATGRRDWKRFEEALDAPGAAQRRVLAETLEAVSGTARASQHNLARVFNDLEPEPYDGFETWIQRAARGEPGVLTQQEIDRFEPSSGSTAASKLLPSTALLRRQFNRGVHAWVCDLYRRRPHLARGPAYWSVSPVVARKRTSGGIPVGFEEDSAYLGRAGKVLVDAAMAVPGDVRHTADIERFRYDTLLFLLAEPELRLISVWNPSFLTTLLDAMERHWNALAEDLHAGVEVFGRKLQRLHLNSINPWPKLGLLSCWTDAQAGRYLPPLLDRLPPDLEVQPKGLLATEGIVSIPYAGTHPLAVTSHYIELLRDDGSLVAVADLREGDEGEIVLTTGAGLCRYRLQDRVVVTGFLRRTPTIRFLGKTDRISDLVGEKLNEAFVSRVLSQLRVQGFAMLAPDGDGYTLYAEDPPSTQVLEEALRDNIHYAWAVDMGQLRPVRTFQVEGDPQASYLQACEARGQRLGDIKPTALDLWDGWTAALSGCYR